MHYARMEFYGYHVFNADYQELTIEQALFIDMGVSKVYNELFGDDDSKSKREIGRLRSRSRRPRKRF